MTEYVGWIEYFGALNAEEEKSNPLEDGTGNSVLREFGL